MESKRIIRSSAILLASIMLVGIASAALLSYFAEIKGTADIEQSILVDGQDYTTPVEYTINGIGGNTYTNGSFPVDNRADVAIPIRFSTEPTYKNAGVWEDASDAVRTRYMSTLELSSKDANWDVTSDMKAYLTYELVSPEFNYDLTATGLMPNTEYSLIYYADKPDRFVEWGGNNPGKLISTFATDENGSYTGSNSVNLGMNLPSPNDANIDEYNYCDSDGYTLCNGAKLWIVPSSDYTEPALTAWNPNTYLFETNLITYSDSSADDTLVAYKGVFDLFIENRFHPLAYPGKYKITTKVETTPVPM